MKIPIKTYGISSGLRFFKGTPLSSLHAKQPLSGVHDLAK